MARLSISPLRAEKQGVPRKGVTRKAAYVP